MPCLGYFALKIVNLIWSGGSIGDSDSVTGGTKPMQLLWGRCKPMQSPQGCLPGHWGPRGDPETMYDHFYPFNGLIASLDSLERLQSSAGSAGGGAQAARVEALR